MEDTMCTRNEVRDEIREATERLERDIHRDLSSKMEALHASFNELKKDFDKEMHQIAREEVQNAKESFTKFVGWGGIVGVGLFIYFFGGMTNDITYLQQDLSELKVSMTELNDFMNRGDRFTVDDGNDLKSYVDQQDEYILRRVDDGFASLSDQISRLQN